MKFVALITLLSVLFISGCSSKFNNDENDSFKYNESMKREEDSMNHNEVQNYEYQEGIYADKDWDNTFATYTGDVIPDKETAISIAAIIFSQIQKNGIGQAYVLKNVFFDTEDSIWILSFGEAANIPGSCYNIAIRKQTGEVLRMWAGE